MSKIFSFQHDINIKIINKNVYTSFLTKSLKSSMQSTLTAYLNLNQPNAQQYMWLLASALDHGTQGHLTGLQELLLRWGPRVVKTGVRLLPIRSTPKAVRRRTLVHGVSALHFKHVSIHVSMSRSGIMFEIETIKPYEVKRQRLGSWHYLESQSCSSKALNGRFF